MGSSEDLTVNDKKYTHPTQITQWNNHYVTLRLAGRKLGINIFGASGVHHFFYIAIDDFDKWIVLEWMDEGGTYSKYANFFCCHNINGYHCRNLGKFYVKEIYEACCYVSDRHSYSSKFDCNDWVRAVCSRLGINIKKPAWNCICVWDKDPLISQEK